MALTRANLRSKYKMMPDPQTVEYRRRSGHSTIASGSNVSYCEHRNPSYSDLQSNQQYLDQVTLLWHVWVEPFEAVFGADERPIKGDHIVHDGKLWIVQRIDDELLRQRWKLFCTKGKYSG